MSPFHANSHIKNKRPPTSTLGGAKSFRYFANRSYFESAMKLAWAAPLAIFLLLIQLI
jgi:hypothetical protein